MGKYSDSEDWEDVIPVAQDDGGPNPLAVIAYTEEYSEAMSYLRALMAQDEKSDRALSLTQDIIRMNPAHYTVWLYRVDVLSELKTDPLKELEWLNSIALKHLKNYQIWHHRQVIMSQVKDLPDSETAFLKDMFSLDTKNYHVWSYRQWLVRHFSLWDSELPFIEELLEDDVRNNSAWNHRWFIVFGRHMDPQRHSIQSDHVFSQVEDDVIQREVDFTKTKISLAPQNPSPWNYLRGIMRKRASILPQVQALAEQYATLSNEEQVRSSHALELAAEIYESQENRGKSMKALDLLANKYDPIRKNYWRYRISCLEAAAANG